ncbi:MAG: DUF374 domain-containing protein [Planctomycetes bacterium]|nr:DUF374 domain-containing protein [Planctomycetota bacterium]
MSSAGPDAFNDPSIQGSAYDQAAQVRAPRRWRRRVRHAVGEVLLRWFVWVVPPLYYALLWLINASCTIDDELQEPLRRARARHDRAVALLWHQEVFTVAFNNRGLHGHTLASTGSFGRVITALLEYCNFVVFRGGSSKGKRRRRKVLPAMIRHMRDTPEVIYGITVDGSHGPAFRMKQGGIAIARSCRAPLYVVRWSYSRRLTFDTWDRTVLPLPFGKLKGLCVGPYWIAPDSSMEELERFTRHMEEELLECCYRAERAVGVERPECSSMAPEGWEPRWRIGQLGRKFGPHDLDPDNPPPWAWTPALTAEAAARRPRRGP